MVQMNGAQALVSQLQKEGVDVVFGLPGVQIMAAIDAFYEQRNTIQLIHTRHEQATTYMADGYAKASGKVGVAMVVPGPGALNATAGLGTAYASSSPVLLLSGQIPSTSLGKRRGELHEIDEQLDVFRPITKWNHRVTDPGAIPEVVHEAFRHLKSGRPRPVELEIPPDTMMAETDTSLIEAKDYSAPAVDAEAIDRAVHLLAQAERPIIVAGGGTISAQAGPELTQLAEITGAAVFTTQQSKGVIADDHPNHLAVNYLISPMKEMFQKCDCMIVVGTRFLIRDFEPEKQPTIIQIDIDPSEIGKNYPAEVAIEADAKEALGALLTAYKASGAPSRAGESTVEAQRQAFRDELRPKIPLQAGMIDQIAQTLGDEAILISGVTNLGYWSNVLYPTRRARNFITSSYFGTLGYAFPTGLGAKVACPDKPVVALCGDGGFLFCLQELSTAKRYGINLISIVFNNHAYGASRWDQTHRFGQRFLATDLDNPDFGKLADAFGVKSFHCQPETLGETLEQALQAKAPVLLEVDVPIMMPPFQMV